ncbi:MAG: cytochrome c [Burkholderiales bacterium]|nr:cytochrome c [Burkholderiales bacterium]
MKRLFPSMLMAAAALAGLATALPAAAQFAKPEDAIKYRKANMTLMATHFGRVAGMANGRIPFDAKLAADNAEMAAAVTKWQFTGFVEGSDKGDTKADPKIWTEKDKFNAAGATLQEAVSKLNVAAKGGNLDAIKAAVGETGKACKGCHDTYQKQ